MRKLVCRRFFHVGWRKSLSFAVSYSTQQNQEFFVQKDGSLYEGHRQISKLQKVLLAVGSAVAAVNNPLRSDMVAALGETVDLGAFQKLHLKMLNDKEGCQIINEKPIIDSNTLPPEELIKLPENTLGYVYAKFMMDNGITSDTRPLVHYVDDTELAYVVKRYRQIHDFVHVILGFSITVPDEIVVKWFEFAHFGFPMNGLASFFGPLACTSAERSRIINFLPWAFYCGTHTNKLLLNVYFEKHLNVDFKKFKSKLGIINPPCI